MSFGLRGDGVDVDDIVGAGFVGGLLQSALTDKINDRETFMKGIDYSYYYEQEE